MEQIFDNTQIKSQFFHIYAGQMLLLLQKIMGSSNGIFSPLQIGDIKVPNRILMAPLTRARASPGHVPNELMAEYYGQRASAGLIIAECTMIQQGCCAFISEPGIHSKEQIQGWKLVTKKVHQKGGRILLQIWHGGRACHPLLNGGKQSVGPSAIAIKSEVHTLEGKKPLTVPRVLKDQQIPGIIQQFKKAAQNAKEAGFDGVEIHGANGYLLDQFLRDGSNKREGPYGGSVQNRARLTLQVTRAVVEVWGKGRVGIRLGLLNSYNDMKDSDPQGLSKYLAQQLNQIGIAFIHVMRADFFSAQKGDVLTPVRKAFKGVVIGNMGYTADQADKAIADGLVDAVTFGTLFLANPDLPKRFQLKSELNKADMSTYYTPGAKGYTDYPYLQ